MLILTADPLPLPLPNPHTHFNRLPSDHSEVMTVHVVNIFGGRSTCIFLMAPSSKILVCACMPMRACEYNQERLEIGY